MYSLFAGRNKLFDRLASVLSQEYFADTDYFMVSFTTFLCLANIFVGVFWEFTGALSGISRYIMTALKET